MKHWRPYWILRGHEAVPTSNLGEWAAFFHDIDQRRVARDFIEQPEHDPVEVSTVFLGTDMGSFDGPPILFESMVFGGPLDGQCYRYCTWDEAVAGHKVLTDAAVLEGKVSALEVRALLREVAIRSKASAP